MFNLNTFLPSVVNYSPQSPFFDHQWRTVVHTPISWTVGVRGGTGCARSRTGRWSINVSDAMKAEPQKQKCQGAVNTLCSCLQEQAENWRGLNFHRTLQGTQEGVKICLTHSNLHCKVQADPECYQAYMYIVYIIFVVCMFQVFYYYPRWILNWKASAFMLAFLL